MKKVYTSEKAEAYLKRVKFSKAAVIAASMAYLLVSVLVFLFRNENNHRFFYASILIVSVIYACFLIFGLTGILYPVKKKMALCRRMLQAEKEKHSGRIKEVLAGRYTVNGVAFIRMLIETESGERDLLLDCDANFGDLKSGDPIEVEVAEGIIAAYIMGEL